MDDDNDADNNQGRYDVSEEGIENLCYALCNEIKYYKSLLNHASNLSPQDVEISMKELADVCPNHEAMEKKELCVVP